MGGERGGSALPAPAARGAEGIAQLAVLWVILVLGALAASFAFSMRTEAMAARNGADGARAYFQARTGIGRFLVTLPGRPPDNVVREVVSAEEEGLGYEVRAEAEGGKVDVNLVPESLLKAILRKAGLAEDEAAQVGDAILDWRDPDDRPRSKGAEAGEYASLPEPVVPRNGRLTSLEELRSVRGVTAELYDRLFSRVFTVHGSAQLDINVAPPRVLLALPGFSPEAVEKVVARRAEGPIRSPAELAHHLGPGGVPPETLGAVAVSTAVRVYTLTAVGTADNVVRVVRCIVDASGGASRIRRWEDHASREGEGG